MKSFRVFLLGASCLIKLDRRAIHRFGVSELALKNVVETVATLSW